MGFLLAATFLALSTTTQQGGVQGNYQRRVTDTIERGISIYLNGDELHSVLTAGEFNDWPLKLRAGQVVFAEASSDAFDPALEIVDAKNGVLAKNDDRYPGDQRPLLMWRCEADGDYLLRVRCFHDKSGGSFAVRYKTYDSVDLSSGKMVVAELGAGAPFLLRVSMKAGQIEQQVVESPGNQDYMPLRFDEVIAPDGLPEESPSLSAPISPAVAALIAPVDGDYYVMESPADPRGGRRKVHVGSRFLEPAKLSAEGMGTAPTNASSIFDLPVKAGDLIEATAVDLDPNCRFQLAEAPDVSKYSMAKDETNPFIPHEHEETSTPAFDMLPARARDGRVMVFRARRDAKLWLATDGVGPASKQFTVHVQPAAADYAEGKSNTGKLRIGYHDYWSFDAKSGDVMLLDSKVSGFDPVTVVRDPDLNEIRHVDAPLDVMTDHWQMVVQRPGRYLLSMACYGDGGAGDYDLSRRVIHAKDFAVNIPATGEIAPGETQVWRFTSTPDNPLLIHWNSSNWNYTMDSFNERGERQPLFFQDLDGHNRYGILKVQHPMTFVIVLTGGLEKASYSIDLGEVPGFKTKGK